MEKHNEQLTFANFSGLKIHEVQKLVKGTEPSTELVRLLEADGRQGLLKLAEQVQRQLVVRQGLQSRFDAMLEYEKLYWSEGFTCIAGVDEAGRGPLAGPVVASAVVIDPDFCLPGLNDSKQLREEERESFYAPILARALGVGVGIVDHQEIDQINILQASFLAMRRALEQLAAKDVLPTLILVDGDKSIPNVSIVQKTIVGGDAASISIAAASVIAKVTRDRMMVQMGKLYPGYGFERHKGYSAPEHIEALRRLGPSPIHRMTFSLVRQELYSEIYHEFAGLLFSTKDLANLREVGLAIGRQKNQLTSLEVEDLRQLYVKFEKKLKALTQQHDSGEKSVKIL